LIRSLLLRERRSQHKSEESYYSSKSCYEIKKKLLQCKLRLDYSSKSFLIFHSQFLIKKTCKHITHIKLKYAHFFSYFYFYSSTQSTPCTPRRPTTISSPAFKRGRGSGAGNLSTPGTPVSMHVRLSSNTSSSSDHSKLLNAESKM